MAKYYVSSGDLRCTISEKDPKKAAITAFQKLKINPVKRLGEITMISEHGFESEADDDMYFCTVELLDETDQLDTYQHSEWL